VGHKPTACDFQKRAFHCLDAGREVPLQVIEKSPQTDSNSALSPVGVGVGIGIGILPGHHLRFTPIPIPIPIPTPTPIRYRLSGSGSGSGSVSSRDTIRITPIPIPIPIRYRHPRAADFMDPGKRLASGPTVELLPAFPAAMLVLLAAATRAGIVAANLGTGGHRFWLCPARRRLR
jgi:hypothetical protein